MLLHFYLIFICSYIYFDDSSYAVRSLDIVLYIDNCVCVCVCVSVGIATSSEVHSSGHCSLHGQFGGQIGARCLSLI